MAAPVLNVIAQRVYDEIAPIAYDDANQNYALAHFVEAWTRSMLLIEGYVRDTSAGPGYSSVMNADTAPAMFLDWLAQFVGIRLVLGESEASKRAKIKALTGLRRGSPNAIKAAAARSLTGTQTVFFTERYDGNAWKLAVATLTSETPDATVVDRDIRTQKPAGITLLYQTVTGGTFATVAAYWPTFDYVTQVYLDFDELRNEPTKRAGWTYQNAHDEVANYTTLNSQYIDYNDLRTPTT